MPKIRLLILGGTVEGAALARLLAGDDRLAVVLSLAGRTRRVRPSPEPVRVGGFGGVDGLLAYLRNEGVGLVVDATHPFAAVIGMNAAQACAAVGCPRLKIIRPPWREAPGDLWTHVPDEQAAAAWLQGRSGLALLTVGRQKLAAFETVSGPRLLARMIEPPKEPTPVEIILGRSPFDVDAEERLMRGRGVTVLVTKNSGGAETAAKLEAARRLAIPVLMIGRPAVPAGDRVETAEAAAAWVEARLAAPHA